MTPLVEVVTTFHPAGYEQYGKRFIQTFKKHWDGNILLSIYAEGMAQPGFLEGERIRWRSYEHHCPEGVEFKQRDMPEAPDVKANRYRFDAKRFSHKSFALADAARRSRADYLLLMDADVETFGHVTPEWVAGLMSEGEHVACLQRPFYHHTESAFVLYRLCPKARDLIQSIEDCYTTGHIFTLDGWCDSSVADYVRGRFEAERGLLIRNLTVGEPDDGLTVFEPSILGTKMRHLKGKRKFDGHHEIQRTGYGARQLAQAHGPVLAHP